VCHNTDSPSCKSSSIGIQSLPEIFAGLGHLIEMFGSCRGNWPLLPKSSAAASTLHHHLLLRSLLKSVVILSKRHNRPDDLVEIT
jgi:hypothetical protein